MRILLLAAACVSQAASFEVASIKPAAASRGPREGGNRARIEYSADSLTMRNVALTDCIQWAYRVEYYQFPQLRSLDSTSYDILAKAAGPVPVRELRLMLQQLLADRFKLTLHHETKEIPVYELTIAKGGPKLPDARPRDDRHGVENLPRIRDGSFVFEDNSMVEFAAKLSQLYGIDRPVVDKTGIDGYFDIVFKGAAAAQLQPDGPSLYTLIQEQLGLKLVGAKAPMEVIVIDRVEKPSEN
jgi:uncharacterized protein (TIGR03435 family)